MAETCTRRKTIRRGGRRVLLLACFAAFLGSMTPGLEGQEPARSASAPVPQPAPSLQLQTRTQPAGIYTLPPDKLNKATHLEKARNLLNIGSTLWGILFLVLILGFGPIAAIRDWAVSVSPRPWLQGFLFLPVLLLLPVAANLPFDIAGHHLSLAYGLSIQLWVSWFWDWTKSLLLTLLSGTLALALLFAIVRRSERRWWFWFWLIALPMQVLILLILPIAIDPLFNHFEPLVRTNPELVEQLERVVARSSLDIPPSRMFLMRASDKVTGLNAYVTGFGASKRVVVWDTTIQKARPDEILFIFGHEQGHYVLNHIHKGLLFSSALILVFLYLGHHLARWLLGRYGERWRVTALRDWASVGVLLLIFSVFGFLAEPIINSFSRVQEHHADIYGQEVIHGLVQDPETTASQAFQTLGEIWLEDPYPSRPIELWLYSHPSTAHRMAFAAQYDPWRPGRQPRFFPKDESH